jgi:hypothetical protein
MQWLPGKSLLQFLLDHPMSIWSLPKRMADLQARLNTLPVLNFPAPTEPHLPRSLREFARIVRNCRFHDMTAALDWLKAQQPAPPSAPCIVHLDFHPLNLLVEEGEFRAVLDWSDATVGDYHADVAATLLLLDASPVKLARWRDWLASLPGRGIMRRRYLHQYASWLPLDDKKLRYYRAWAAFRRLVTWRQWLHLGPQGTGVKASTASNITPRRLHFLARYFETYSGVAIRLPAGVAGCSSRSPAQPRTETGRKILEAAVPGE